MSKALDFRFGFQVEHDKWKGSWEDLMKMMVKDFLDDILYIQLLENGIVVSIYFTDWTNIKIVKHSIEDLIDDNRETNRRVVMKAVSEGKNIINLTKYHGNKSKTRTRRKGRDLAVRTIATKTVETNENKISDRERSIEDSSKRPERKRGSKDSVHVH